MTRRDPGECSREVANQIQLAGTRGDRRLVVDALDGRPVGRRGAKRQDDAAVARQSPGETNSTTNVQQAPSDALQGEMGGQEADKTTADPTAERSPTVAKQTTPVDVVWPLATLGIGIAIVLGLIIGMKVNAFIALISAAIVVSLLAPGEPNVKIQRVADAFGGMAGGIGIVIALAAVIGKCMLDSGAADRIVRSFVHLLGEKRAPWALMGSGYVLAVPVFFDTVFYLLVPLARSLHRRTGKHYLKYILAIAAGGAITHSLVPPTPGPLLMASTLNIDLGVMIMIGALVALPAAVAGVVSATVLDRIMPVPMRSLGAEPEPDPLSDDQLPSLWLSLTPVLLPVLLISINTVFTTYADLEPVARVTADEIKDWPALESNLRAPAENSPEGRLRSLLSDSSREALAAGSLSESQRDQLLNDINLVIAERAIGMGGEGYYRETSFLDVRLTSQTRDLLDQGRQRMGQAMKEHINRQVLEEGLNRDALVLQPHQWETTRRRAANWSQLIGNPNLALLISTIIAMWMLVRQRGLSRRGLANVVETSLMSGGVIILITAGGGAFGAMLQAARIGPAIESLFQFDAGGSRLLYLLLGFAIAVVLKIAQGSSTVAMIVGSSMMAAIVSPEQLGCHPVYLATSIGGGSLVGSWMNDSGFWIFAKMGALTEAEALKSWTVMLVVLGVVSLLMSMFLASIMPMAL